MRSILAGLGAGLWLVSLAAAQSTTTTVAPPTSTTVATSTSTSTTASSSSTTSTPTTSTSVSTVCVDGGDTFYDPRVCAQSSGTKEECRQDCCSADFDMLVEPCNGCGECDEADWTDFVDQWKQANTFYNSCLREGGNAQVFTLFNLPDSCREYVGGCKNTALKHVRQCADAERCVTCCRTALSRWRQKITAKLRHQSEEPRRCQKAIRCLRRAGRKSEACRNACRHTPTCGQDQVKICLASKAGGRDVLECYGKCTDKCSNPEAYPWCIQACQGLDECNAFEDCVGISGSSTTTTTLQSTAAPAAIEAAGKRGCLEREDRTCITVTTTSTSTSSSTSSTARSTTSTSTSTTISVP